MRTGDIAVRIGDIAVRIGDIAVRIGGKIAPALDIELRAATVRRILPTGRAILASVGPILGR
ncbi:MAG TPA: hypothetical protein VGF13_04055, partial [Verrucomicrobiae bacterium]